MCLSIQLQREKIEAKVIDIQCRRKSQKGYGPACLIFIKILDIFFAKIEKVSYSSMALAKGAYTFNFYYRDFFC